MLIAETTPVVELKEDRIARKGVRLLLKREDLNHPFVSGNKLWKLLPNLRQAHIQNLPILTFGGAFSNHIYATAAAGKELSIETIGVIRGERVSPLSGTLKFAERCGMKLHFVPRQDYARKEDNSTIEALREKFGSFYLIPEGGTNNAAIESVKTWATSQLDMEYDVLCVSVGTGGTMAGILKGITSQKSVVGFAPLKGEDTLSAQVKRWLDSSSLTAFPSWKITNQYHFGGYGKVPSDLLEFLSEFEQRHGFQLDPIYTGKMIYGILDLIDNDFFPIGTTILAIHTGGIQGWQGIIGL